MNMCKMVTRDLEKLIGQPPPDMPEALRSHVAACPTCGRQLAAARLAHGLIDPGCEAILPPDGFANRVRTALAARTVIPRSENVWRPAWGLMPTFAAAVAALFIVYQTSEGPAPVGWLPIEGMSAGEYLLLGPSGPDLDDALTAVLEGGGK